MKDIVDLFFILFIIFMVIMYFKNQVTYKNMCIIGNAIYLYNSEMIQSCNYEKILDYDIVIPECLYTRTLFRLFDWSYYNILPNDIFALINPYIPEAIEKYYDDRRKR